MNGEMGIVTVIVRVRESSGAYVTLDQSDSLKFVGKFGDIEGSTASFPFSIVVLSRPG